MRIIRAGEHIQHIPGWGVTVRESGVAVAESNWWEVAGKTCVAAYQPKGAASYAASKVNLANPGTYDATDGVAYPTWAAATGWTFNGTNQFLATGGITHVSGAWSHIIRIANPVNTGGDVYFYGGWEVPTENESRISCGIRWGTTRWLSIWGNGASTFVSADFPAVVGQANARLYINGTDKGAAGGTISKTMDQLYLVGARGFGSSASLFYAGDILAFAVYSQPLTAAEMATVSAAMAAL